MDKFIKGAVLFLFMLVSIHPIKAYNSGDVFLFTAPKGATVYGMARELSIPIDTLMKYNPKLQNGLKAGMQLHLPAIVVSEDNLKKIDAYPTFVGGALFDLCYDETQSSLDESKAAVIEEVLSEENPNANNGRANGELRAMVARDGKVGFINEYGKEVIPLMYDDATNFYNGYAYVRKCDYHYLIDKDGNIVTDITSYMPSQYMRDKYSNGSYNPLDGSVYIYLDEASYESDYQRVFITWDTNGKIQKINLKVPKGALWSSYSRILNGEVLYFITNRKRKSAPLEFSAGTIIVESIGVYDKDYNLKFSSTAKDLHPFSNGLARITDFKNTNAGGHGTSIKYKVQYGFVDLTGRKLPNCNYDYAMDFSDGLARVAMNGKSGYIDTTGKVVIPFTFDGEMPQTVDKSEKEFWETSDWQWDLNYNYKIGQFNNGLAIQTLDGQYVIINKDGEIINPLSEFKGLDLFVEHFNNGIIIFYYQPSIWDGTVFSLEDPRYGCSAYDINGSYIVPHKKYSDIGPFIRTTK